jgi:hypothetical protein
MSCCRDKETAFYDLRNKACGTLELVMPLSIDKFIALNMQHLLYCSVKATMDSSNMIYNQVAKKASDETRSNARR